MQLSPTLSLSFSGVLMFTNNDGMELNNPVTVGNGSDVLIQVACSDSSGALGSWMFINESTIPEPLTAFGISQDPMTGVLRIYPAPLIDEIDLKSFICLANGIKENINFTLGK